MTPDLTIFNPILGMELAVEGADRAHGNATEAWKAHAEATILEVGRMAPTFTVSDVVRWCEVRRLPLPANGSAWGAVFRRLSAAKRIVFTGQMLPSPRAQRHSDLERVWRLA
jgi:hypothetical protein